MVTIEIKVSDYRQPGSWEAFMDVESKDEAARIIRHLKGMFRKEKKDGLAGRFESWDYRIR